MPLTFLSHQAVVLPLKIKAPNAVNGTALVLGSMAPDVEYFLRGYPTSTIGHTWTGQLTFCLPVTLALFWIVTRLVAEPAAVHAPEGADLRLADYALIRWQPSGPRHWLVVAFSALIGSLSHVALDRVLDRWGGMPYHAIAATRGWVVVNLGVWVVLALITLRLMQHIGRHRLLERWAISRSKPGEPDDARLTNRISSRPPGQSVRSAPRNPGAFWGWVFFCAISGAVLGVYYRRPGFFLYQGATWVHVWLCSMSAAFLGLVLASVVWHSTRSRWRSVQLRGNLQ